MNDTCTYDTNDTSDMSNNQNLIRDDVARPRARDELAEYFKFSNAFFSTNSTQVLYLMLTAKTKMQFNEIASNASDDDLAMLLAAGLAHAYDCLDVVYRGKPTGGLGLPFIVDIKWVEDIPRPTIRKQISQFDGQYQDNFWQYRCSRWDVSIGINLHGYDYGNTACSRRARTIFGRSLSHQVDATTNDQGKAFGQKISAVTDFLQTTHPTMDTTCRPSNTFLFLVQHLLSRFGQDLLQILKIEERESGLSPLEEKEEKIANMTSVSQSLDVEIDKTSILFPPSVDEKIQQWAQMETAVTKPLRWIRNVMFRHARLSYSRGENQDLADALGKTTWSSNLPCRRFFFGDDHAWDFGDNNAWDCDQDRTRVLSTLLENMRVEDRLW